MRQKIVPVLFFALMGLLFNVLMTELSKSAKSAVRPRYQGLQAVAIDQDYTCVLKGKEAVTCWGGEVGATRQVRTSTVQASVAHATDNEMLITHQESDDWYILLHQMTSGAQVESRSALSI